MKWAHDFHELPLSLEARGLGAAATIPRGAPKRPEQSSMKLRTRLNLVVASLTAVFVAVLITEEILDTRSSVREEIEAANRVASPAPGTPLR